MVIDKVDGNDIPRYLAYDIVTFNGNEVGNLPFYPTRWQMIETEIINARVEAMKDGIIDRSSEPFSMRRKDFWNITQTEYLLGDRFTQKLSHDPDGLIFQPSKEVKIQIEILLLLNNSCRSHNSRTLPDDVMTS